VNSPSKVLQAIWEVEEVMILDVNEAECTTEVNVCPALPKQNHFVDVQFLVPSSVRV
jgi:hypothetical protein